MKKLILLAMILAGCDGISAAESNKAPFVPNGKQIETDVVDMTERWQTLFGLDGKLTISNGRSDDRIAIADGPTKNSFDAKVTQVGWYAFTFILVHGHKEQVLQLHTVWLQVRKDAKNPRQPVITPHPTGYEVLSSSAAPEDTFIVKWEHNPGGEGIPGGWRLLSTSYSDSIPPGLAEFETKRGE